MKVLHVVAVVHVKWKLVFKTIDRRKYAVCEV